MLVIDVVPDEELVMPLNVQTGVVVTPLVPIAIELAAVVLPIIFEEMVKLPAAPLVMIPLKVYPEVAIPPVLIP